MYNFTDTNEILKSYEMGIQTTFNGKTLERELTNENGAFQTVMISGRGVVDQEHQTVDVAGRNGKVFRRKSYKEREIEITALISGINNSAFRLQFEKLNELLDTNEPSDLIFGDEPDRIYKAQFESADIPDEESNQQIIKLKMICYDPKKLTNKKTVTGNQVNYAGSKETFPKISFMVGVNVNEINLLHVEQQKYIRLKGTYTQGNRIEIDMKERTIKLNGRNELKNFDMVNSRFFSLQKGANTLRLTPSSQMTIEFSEVYQ